MAEINAFKQPQVIKHNSKGNGMLKKLTHWDIDKLQPTSNVGLQN
jgi:hypothetical protein